MHVSVLKGDSNTLGDKRNWYNTFFFRYIPPQESFFIVGNAKMPRFFARSGIFLVSVIKFLSITSQLSGTVLILEPTLLPFINTSITKMTLFAWNRQLWVRFVLIKNRNFTEKAINAPDLRIDVSEDIETNLITDTLAYLA